MKWWWIVVLALGVGLALWIIFSPQQPLTIKPMFQNEPITAQVDLGRGSIQAGQTRRVFVHVQREGQPFALYANQYAMHLIVTSVDQSSFLHTVNLEEGEVGIYGTDVTFGSPGPYRVWVEVLDAKAEQHHFEHAGLLGYADFQVHGQAGEGTVAPLVFGKEAQAGPYTVTLDYAPLKAGQESEVHLSVKDSQGKLRKLLQPEPDIYFIVGPRGDASFPFFRHGHSQPPEHGDTVSTWKEIFPKVGQYLLWTTVYLAGTNTNNQTEALELPFVLTVGP